jgi:WD40 repeat protein
MAKQIFLILVLFIQPLILIAQEEYLIKEFRDHKAPVQSVCFSPDGKYLLSGGDDKIICFHNLETLSTDYTYDNFFVTRAILVTSDNHIYFGSGPDIKEIDYNNNPIAVFKGNTTHIWSIDYAKERNRLVAGSFDYNIKVWNGYTNEVELILKGHTKSTLPVAFSPDEKYIVSGSLDRTIKIWNAQNGELIKSLEGHSDNIYDIEFHPSGMYFASASRDNTIRLWDFSKGTVLMTYPGHDKAVFEVKFTPDGNHLLSASLDGSIRLWETKTGKMVYTYTGHTGGTNSIAVSADGKYLASGGNDNKVRLYELNKKTFVEFASYDEFNSEKDQSGLFRPKQKNETKQKYEDRRLKAKQFESEIIEKYYQKYREELKKKSFKIVENEEE